MNDFEAFFETIHEAKSHAESLPWCEVNYVQIVHVDVDTEHWRDCGRCGDIAKLNSLDVILKGKRYGHHEEAFIEWAKTSIVYIISSVNE